jgi:hypothetical protein
MRVFRKPASFLCAYVYLEGGARQRARRPSCSPATRPGLAVNIVKLPEPPAPPIKARPTFGVRPQSTVRDQAVG